jgi:hypothetical protein
MAFVSPGPASTLSRTSDRVGFLDVSMTLALAIIGAVTGVIAMLLDLLRYAFDRPRLKVGFHVSRSIEHPALIGIDVTNHGRQPTTILKVAFRPDAGGEIRDPESGALMATGIVELTLSQEPTVVPAHGGVRQFRWSLTEWPGPFHADEPFRAYVIDSYRNRPTWGPAAPVLRMLLNNGWKPSGASADMLKPAPQPIRPQPVEPRWKLWKHKDFRKPPLPERPGWPPGADEEGGDG